MVRLTNVSKQIKLEDFESRHTSPRRTRKDNTIRRQVLELILQNVEAVTLKPGDLISHPVDLGIVFGAPQDSRVLLDGVDALPLPRECKGDGVTPRAGESIDQDAAPGGYGAGYVICDFARKVKSKEIICE